MDNKFSKSWINMRIHYDDLARSTILIDFVKKQNISKNYTLIDMCTGSGSFLIWTLKRGLQFKNNILIDNDMNLLKSIKRNLRHYLKNIFTIKSSTNNLNLLINDSLQKESNVKIKRADCDTYPINDKDKYVISYSAALDLMSKSSIDTSLEKVNKNNILFYSLCFDGTIKWKSSHPFDKYISSFFNNHQMSDKGFGKALGYKSISFTTQRAKELGYEVTIADSSWMISNKYDQDKVFLKRYILDIKKALYHMEGIDKSMLRKWYSDKLDQIMNKKTKAHIGHKDILIFKK